MIHNWFNIRPMSSLEGKDSLELLHARWVLGGMGPDELVQLAVSALQREYDGTALRQLAGLSAPTSRELGTLPARAFADMGIKPIGKDAAASILLDRGELATSSVISALRHAFPAFSDRLREHVVKWHGVSGPYTAMSQLVHLVVEDLYEKGALDETRRVFAVLEQLLLGADQEARNLIGLGFFETLQNVASWRPGGNKVYEQFFGPISRRIWSELQTMWAGKSSLMDVIRAEQRNK